MGGRVWGVTRGGLHKMGYVRWGQGVGVTRGGLREVGYAR